MPLPTTSSTVDAGKQFTTAMAAPAVAPLQSAVSAFKNPLQTLNAPPAITNAAAAIGTMFGAERNDTAGGVKALKGASRGLQGAGASLNQAGTSLNTAASALNQDVIPNILQDVRDSIFAIEIGIEKTQEWLGKIFRQGEETGKSPRAPQGQMRKDGKFAGFRKKREDKTEDLEALEKEREEAREGEDGDEGEAKAEAEKKSSMLSGIFDKIPGFKMISGLLSGGGGLLKVLFTKLLWPVTLIIGIVSFVTGFMKGYEEGGIIEGLKMGFENLIENLIDVPLNMLKELVSWFLTAFGFDEAAATLDSVEFDFSGGFVILVDSVVAWVTKLWASVTQLWTDITGFFTETWESITGAIKKFTEDPIGAIGGVISGGLANAWNAVSGGGGDKSAPKGDTKPPTGPRRPRRDTGGGIPSTTATGPTASVSTAAVAAKPTATASVSMAPGEGATSDTPGVAGVAGTGLGSTGDLLSDMAGDLGVAVLGGGFGVQKISEHPRFGGYSATHKSAAHKEHRAIDIGTGASAGTKWNAAENRYDYESIQNPIRAYMERWAAARGAKLKIIGGDWPGSKDLARQHQDHLHVEIASAAQAGAEVGGPGPGIRIPETGGRNLGPPPRAAAAAPVIINAGGGATTSITNSSSTAQISAPASPRGPGLPTLSSIEYHGGSTGYQPT